MSAVCPARPFEPINDFYTDDHCTNVGPLKNNLSLPFLLHINVFTCLFFFFFDFIYSSCLLTAVAQETNMQNICMPNVY